MTDVSTIYLVDAPSGEGVEAELRDAIEEAQLADWQTQWQPALIKVLQELRRQGVPIGQWPQSWHWDWREKTARVQGFLAFPGFSVVCHGVTQGLMLLDLRRAAREQSQAGKPLVYIDYLEVAPWNRPDLGQRPRLKGVGTALLTAAVALSEQEGYRGRIGLHALPQSEVFYRERCRMADLGPDDAYQNLKYFEMTAESARSFLDKE